MEQDSFVPQLEELVWEAPSVEEIRVSAEATAYMGVLDDAE
jgi:coenzyme PQQ precursor peptide PqqA